MIAKKFDALIVPYFALSIKDQSGETRPLHSSEIMDFQNHPEKINSFLINLFLIEENFHQINPLIVITVGQTVSRWVLIFKNQSSQSWHNLLPFILTRAYLNIN